MYEQTYKRLEKLKITFDNLVEQNKKLSEENKSLKKDRESLPPPT